MGLREKNGLLYPLDISPRIEVNPQFLFRRLDILQFNLPVSHLLGNRGLTIGGDKRAKVS